MLFDKLRLQSLYRGDGDVLRVCSRKTSDLALSPVCPIKILVNDDFMHLLLMHANYTFPIEYDMQSNVIVTAVPYVPRLLSSHYSVLSQFLKASI